MHIVARDAEKVQRAHDPKIADHYQMHDGDDPCGRLHVQQSTTCVVVVGDNHQRHYCRILLFDDGCNFVQL
jgi:hypothetical protein